MDSNGCSLNKTCVVSEPDPLLIDFEKTELNCYGDSNGIITSNVKGGIKPYVYLWNNGDTTKEIKNLSANIYSLTVTDSNGCVIIGYDTIIEPPPVQAVEIIGPDQVHKYDIVKYSVNNIQDYTFNWFVTGGNILSGQSTNIINVHWGSFNTGIVIVVPTNQNGCKGDTIKIEVNIVSTGIYNINNKEMEIFPNPFKKFTFIQFPNKEHNKYNLLVRYLTGKIVKIRHNISESKIELNRNGLPKGIYLIEIKGPKIYRGKILIE